MIDDEGRIHLTDFSTGKYLENDLVTDDHSFHGPWGYGPEGFTGEDYSYNADVPYYALEFATLASSLPKNDDGKRNDPYMVLRRKTKKTMSYPDLV